MLHEATPRLSLPEQGIYFQLEASISLVLPLNKEHPASAVDPLKSETLQVLPPFRMWRAVCRLGQDTGPQTLEPSSSSSL